MSNEPEGKQIIHVILRPDGDFATCLHGDANECFNALLCAAGHFATGVGSNVVEVCEKLLEAAMDSKLEKISTEGELVH